MDAHSPLDADRTRISITSMDNGSFSRFSLHTASGWIFRSRIGCLLVALARSGFLGSDHHSARSAFSLFLSGSARMRIADRLVRITFTHSLAHTSHCAGSFARVVCTSDRAPLGSDLHAHWIASVHLWISLHWIALLWIGSAHVLRITARYLSRLPLIAPLPRSFTFSSSFVFSFSRFASPHWIVFWTHWMPRSLA